MASQLPGELACAAADLEHCGARADPRRRQDGFDDLGGIALAGGVITPGDAVEKAPLLLPLPALLVGLGSHDDSMPKQGRTTVSLGPLR
jgi:hypothetical protein